MARKSINNIQGYTLVLASLAIFSGLPAYGQVPVNDSGYPIVSLGNGDFEASGGAYESDSEPLTAVELETLVGPIALYPDDLLAIVLPASTYPLQIVQAARFLEAYASDNSLEPDESWDESVIALLNYPEAVQLLNDDIDWTWQLGEAVIAQQADIISAVESFRNRAYAAGNLKSDEHQTVSRNADIIEIDPIEEDIIYVPYYEPERVVTRQPQTVYYYYDQPRPVYYYPYASGYAFSPYYFWGVTTAFNIAWTSNHLGVYHQSYSGHPYYGHSYFGQHYRRPSINVHNTVYVNNARRYSSHHSCDGDYWRPRRHVGARPSDYFSHTRQYRTDVRRTHHDNDRHGTSHRTRDRNRSHGTHHRNRAHNEIQFRHREPNKNNAVRRDQHDRHDVNRQQNRASRMAFAGSTERHQERQAAQTDKRLSQQVRETPPQRRINQAASRQHQQLQARNRAQQPRHQQPVRVSAPAHRSGENHQAQARKIRKESRPPRAGKSKHRKQSVKEDRTEGRKSGRSESKSSGSRKEHTTGRHKRHTRESN